MKSMKLLRRASAAAVAAAVFLAACSGSGPDPGGNTANTPAPTTASGGLTLLTIGTADSGGSMYAAGAALARAFMSRDTSLRFNINASTGSFSNVADLIGGQVDLALVSSDIANMAVRGKGAFEGKPAELRAIASVYTSISNWMARDDSGIEYVHDLAGRSAAIGPESSATDRAARNALAAVGISMTNGKFVNAGLGSGADMVASGELDAVHGFAGPPIPWQTRLAEEQPCHLLRYTAEELAGILSTEPSYIPVVIPAGTYKGQTEDIGTFGAQCVLCVSASMDEEQAYRLTELLCESLEELADTEPVLSGIADEILESDGLPVQLHPGAERYYREHRPEVFTN